MSSFHISLMLLSQSVYQDFEKLLFIQTFVNWNGKSHTKVDMFFSKTSKC